MSAISDAVGLERIARTIGYKLIKGSFQESSPNLPQRVAITGEANTANQGNLTADGGTDPWQFTSLAAAATKYGFGSPIYHMLRIMFPKTGGGIGGIPVIVYPQVAAVGATAKVLEISPVGTATANVTHTVKLAGRSGVDAQFYDFTLNIGDGSATINDKISDAINNCAASPAIASNTDYVTDLTSKWKGLSANGMSAEILTNGNDAGIVYTVSTITAGAGTPSISASLAKITNEWVTILVNGYGTVSTIMDALESFNGRPDPTNPTGRFAGLVFKPLIAITGTVDEDPSAITDARLNECTIALAPAPLSKGFHFEAAANMAVLFARKSQDTPELDVGGSFYPDMPTPTYIGAMEDYNTRDQYVKKGCTTVDLVAGLYQVQDFVTTYHPLGEEPPQYRYCRNLMLDNNVRYGYYLLELANVIDHVIANDDDTVDQASKVVKPKMWKGVLFNYAENLVSRGLCVNATFMQESIVVGISTTNPDRFETAFSYKRSGIARISSTTAEAGFNFGTIN